MADTSNYGRLDERLASIDTRVKQLEEEFREQRQNWTGLLVEMKVLQTRVTLYAGAISVVTALAIKLVPDLLR